MKDTFNNWYKHSNSPSMKYPNGYKLQLKGDTRLWPTYLEQCAIDCELPNFMKDFDKVLEYAEKNNLSLFTLYVSEVNNLNNN